MKSFRFTDTVMTGHARQIHIRPLIVHAAASVLIIGSLVHAVALSTVHPAIGIPPTSSTVSLKDAAHKQSSLVYKTSQTAGGTTMPIATAGKPVMTASPAICLPDSYSGPTNLDLSSAAAGLTQVIDATHYYQINGYTAAQARQQIMQCAPKLSGDGDYTGYTSYRLSWLYNYSDNGSGQCTLNDVKIGMHIGEVLPSLQLTTATDTGFAAKWRDFAPALDTHEHGHITINEQYAAKLLSDLQAMPATDCTTVNQVATATINTDVAALNQANASYDTQTNHGATQGAILP